MATAALQPITITPPETATVEAEGSALARQAEALVVTNVEQHSAAQFFLRDVATMARKISDLFGPVKKSTHEAHKKAVAAEKSLLGPLERARAAVSRKLGDYEAEERRKAEEERRRLEADARKREEERQLMAAIEAEEAGDEQRAAEILDEPPPPPPVIAVPMRLAKVEGVSSRVTWDAEEAPEKGGFDALIKWVAENTADRRQYLEPCTKELRAAAVRQRESFAIPGYRAVSKTGQSVRA